MKLGIGHLFHTLRQIDFEKYDFEAHIDLSQNITDEMSAKFKYLLFNYHSNEF